MILVTRSNAIYSSPRVEKYIEFYEKMGISFLSVGWDRLGDDLQREKTIYYKEKSGYNIGGLRASIFRLKWMIFLLKTFYLNRKYITTIHAFDLDTAFPACVYKLFFNCKVKVIFDVCDWFSATLYNQNSFILSIFKKMEKFTIKYSDEVIICEPERIEQISYKLNHKELIVPNIPSFSDMTFLYQDDKYKFKNDKIIVSYVGGFSMYRMLNELLDIAEQGLINLLIAGYGSEDVEMRCEKASALANIKYWGRVPYKEGLNIMYNSELIYAMYSKSNPNHYYAASNKYYEAMMLGKPILSTKGINLATKITNDRIGYVVEESLSDIKYFMQHLDREDMKIKGSIAQKLWNDKYKSCTLDFLNDKYIKIIQCTTCLKTEDCNVDSKSC